MDTQEEKAKLLALIEDTIEQHEYLIAQTEQKLENMRYWLANLKRTFGFGDITGDMATHKDMTLTVRVYFVAGLNCWQWELVTNFSDTLGGTLKRHPDANSALEEANSGLAEHLADLKSTDP